MASTLGGDDRFHDLSDKQKDKEEKLLREAARKLLDRGSKKERARKLSRANEISRTKARRSHQGAD